MSSNIMAAATSVASPATVANDAQPPIVYFLQLLQQFLSATFALTGYIAPTVRGILSILLKPISTASTPVIYLFAPVFVLTNILFEVFVLTPYYVLAYVLHAVYPLYVLVGTAFICACAVGLGARLVIYGAKLLLLEPQSEKSQPPSIRVTQPDEDMKPRRKVPKRVSIKEERYS
ncbi:hypothetical protein BXZ70DRAFT_1008627 [Cristinia sonorae]|uniref:Transmembrane protein n=1 Tax=Cristinia sonorae TaxID=1940300 RepID=A0A8K0XPC1_9AGAR|nr:hypothetical protein BXZ70DRAFT_1008627 [Cristinia sonorae]